MNSGVSKIYWGTPEFIHLIDGIFPFTKKPSSELLRLIHDASGNLLGDSGVVSMLTEGEGLTCARVTYWPRGLVYMSPIQGLEYIYIYICTVSVYVV